MSGFFPKSPTANKVEACEFKKYGCGEVLKAEEMDRHLRDQMSTHLMLVVEKFEQQIEMNTFMMAHFTEQMEEQVDKSMQLVQQNEKRQSATEAKLNDFLKISKIANDTSLIESQIQELRNKQRLQKDAIDNVKTELGHSIDQHGVNLQLLQDRVETNANMLVERLYSQVQHLEELLRQNAQDFEQKIEAKEKSHASYHSLLQDRFHQAIIEQQAPLESWISRVDQKTERLAEEGKNLQAQLIQVREGAKVLQRQHERLEVEMQIVQVKVDRPTHRRSASAAALQKEDSQELKDSPTITRDLVPSSPQSGGVQSAPASPQQGPPPVDTKRMENVETGIKRLDSAQKSFEQMLQAHQAQVEEALREIRTKLGKHEEAITLDEKERERQKLEEKEKFKLEEKEREELEDRITSATQEKIEKLAGNIVTWEKVHKNLESQVQQTLVDIRDIKEEIEKNRALRVEIEDKLKQETKDLKDAIEKLKKKEKEELEELKKLAKEKEKEKPIDQKVAGKQEQDKSAAVSKPIPAAAAPETPKASPAKIIEEKSLPTSPIIPKIKSDDNVSIAKYGEKAILWEYDPVGGKWMRLVISLRMDAKPFAEGALRHAFNAEATAAPAPPSVDLLHDFYSHPQELFPPSDQLMALSASGSLPPQCEAKNCFIPGTKFVVKVYKKDAEQKASRELYFEDVKMQMVCRDWGNKFNQKKPPKRIEFLMAWVLELVDRSPPVLCNMEPLLVGEFKKNNSNFGAVLNTRSTPQAFSHFTYEQSNKSFIIVDIQGVEDHYTDPQIHTADGKGYGLGNLGKNGIQRFLSTHRCNAVCALLALGPIGMGSTRKPQLRGTMVMPDIVQFLPPSEVKVGARGSGGGLGSSGRGREERDSNSSMRNKELKLVQTIQGHRDRISAVCFLSTENLICTASADATIKIFDVKTWKCIDTLTGHKKAVECLCSNDRYLFSGSADQSIKVWDPKRDFRCIQTMFGHKGEISAICISNKYIISASFDKTIKIWDLSTYQEIKTLESHTKSVKCLCLAGSYLFSGSNDLLIYVWDLDALAPIFTLEGHEEWVKAVVMGGQSLISGSHDSTIKVWDLTEFSCMQTLKGHRDAVVALLAQGSILYSGSEDNSIAAWDLTTLESICTVPKAHPLGVQAFAMVDKRLVSVSVDGSIKMWEWGAK